MLILWPAATLTLPFPRPPPPAPLHTHTSYKNLYKNPIERTPIGENFSNVPPVFIETSMKQVKLKWVTNFRKHDRETLLSMLIFYFSLYLSFRLSFIINIMFPVLSLIIITKRLAWKKVSNWIKELKVKKQSWQRVSNPPILWRLRDLMCYF